MLMIVPKCRECKNTKNMKFDRAWTKDKVGFFVVYCTKCYQIMECNIDAILSKTHNSPKEKDE